MTFSSLCEPAGEPVGLWVRADVVVGFRRNGLYPLSRRVNLETIIGRST
jgi:hypothetical protein